MSIGGQTQYRLLKSSNDFRIIDNFFDKRELICPIEFCAWQNLKAPLCPITKTESRSCSNCFFIKDYYCTSDVHCENLERWRKQIENKKEGV